MMAMSERSRKWSDMLREEGTVHFAKPPVGEVVCDLQLEGMNWGLLEYGRYFEAIRERYSEHQYMPELRPLTATPLEVRPGDANFQIEMSTKPPMPRVWFRETAGNFLIQVQKDRFILNWRKLGDENIYPRFTCEDRSTGVWDRFASEWEVFRKFCRSQTEADPKVKMCELAYINHLARGVDWSRAEDLGRLLKPFQPAAEFHFREGLAAGPEGIHLSMLFALPNGMGSLVLRSYSGSRVSDSREMCFLELRARGAPEDGRDESLAEWFATAHRCIVLGFVDLLTDEGKRLWGYSASEERQEG